MEKYYRLLITDMVVYKMKREKWKKVLRTLFPGCIVILDLDSFENEVEARGWSKYTPNPVTGELTHLVEDLSRKYHGVIIYGLDYERGTEEAVIEFPSLQCSELKEDLEKIKHKINNLGVGITIVCKDGMVSAKLAGTRREAYHSTPWRKTAFSLLRKGKRKGGNRVIID